MVLVAERAGTRLQFSLSVRTIFCVVPWHGVRRCLCTSGLPGRLWPFGRPLRCGFRVGLEVAGRFRDPFGFVILGFMCMY